MTQVAPYMVTDEESYAKDCGFCVISRGESEYAHDKLLFKEGNYIAIASLGSLVPGWLLLLPVEHRLNLSDLYVDARFSAWRSSVAKKLGKSMRAPVQMFEHGATRQTSVTGCGVDHAHLHLLALDPVKMVSALSQFDVDITWNKMRLSDVGSFVSRNEYLLYAMNAEEKNPVCQVSILQRPESQYFRRVVAAAVGLPRKYDYRSFPFVQNVMNTQHFVSEQSNEAP